MTNDLKDGKYLKGRGKFNILKRASDDTLKQYSAIVTAAFCDSVASQ